MTPRPSLSRLLSPQSVAVVGASESSVASQTVSAIVDRDIESFFVNPKRDTVFGRPAYPSLADIGRPIDAVLSLLPAAAAVQLAEQAALLEVGGMVLVAGGFAEAGGDGIELQRRLTDAAAAGNMPMVGPNGVGFINVTRGIELTFLPRFDRRPGGVSIVAHSGAMLEAFASSAHRSGGVGLHLLISAGNEAVTDMADYLDYLVDDPDTRAIALGLEKIRRPQAFFAAAARARAAGKPIVVLKLGRTERSQQMARSHTGTITGDAWVYDVAFKQAGILLAHDVDDLVDRLQFLEQLPNDKWSEVRGLAVLTGTGGFASLAADLAGVENVDIPEVERLSQWIGTVVPGAEFANPLDATGFVVTRPEIWDQVIETYSDAPEFDAFIYLSQFADWDLRSRRFSDQFAVAAQRTSKPFLVSPLAGHAGGWVDEYRTEHTVGVGNGLRGSFRGLNSMALFMRSRADVAVRSPDSVPPIAEPVEGWVHSKGGLILGFAATMDLLRSVGIAVAPFQIYGLSDSTKTTPSFAGPYVAKLADVAHRTEHGAVTLNVSATELPAAIDSLRALAADHSLPPDVAVQAMISGHGEVFAGLTGNSELGPLVAFGLGGIFVEVIRELAGRLAPLSPDDARDLLREFDSIGIIDGFRGRKAWNRPQLEQLLVAVGNLIAGGRAWIGEMDINPLILTDAGIVAVDAVCFRADE
jgi:acetate---CoA ligase (ADP-forming)